MSDTKEEIKKPPPPEEEESQTSAADRDPVIDQAKDLVNTFVKTIKAFRLYPPENPSLLSARDQLFQKFKLFLKQHQAFALQIGEYDLSFKGAALYSSKDLKTSLAFFLYKDGLRELRFSDGLEDKEIQDLLDIIKRSEVVSRLEDDLVTLLWEKDFSHISYVAEDHFLQEAPILIPESSAQFREKLVYTPLAHNVEPGLGDPEEEGIELQEILSRKDAEAVAAVADRSVYTLTPEELENLRREVEAETDPSAVFNIIEILFEILALEREREPYQDAVDLLLKMLEALLSLGEFQKAADLLTRLNIIVKTFDLQAWQIEAIQQVAAKAADPQRIERVGKILDRGEGVRLEGVSNYLLLLPNNAIEPLMKVLGELGNSKSRRLICDALCQIAKNDVDRLIPFIDDRRWFLVRNLVYILGRIGKEQCLPSIQRTLRHGEARVRREAVQALGLIGGNKALPLLSQAMGDEDMRIRSLAVLNWARVGQAAILPSLLEKVQGKEFTRKDSGEMKAYFDAIGIVGSKQAIPVLKKLLEQKSWLGGVKKEEMRFGAASALATMNTPEAQAILEAGKQAKDDGVRKACLQACGE